MSIEIPPWSGVPRYVAELCRMEKEDDAAVCTMWKQPDVDPPFIATTALGRSHSGEPNTTDSWLAAFATG